MVFTQYVVGLVSIFIADFSMEQHERDPSDRRFPCAGLAGLMLQVVERPRRPAEPVRGARHGASRRANELHEPRMGRAPSQAAAGCGIRSAAAAAAL